MVQRDIYDKSAKRGRGDRGRGDRRIKLAIEMLLDSIINRDSSDFQKSQRENGQPKKPVPYIKIYFFDRAPTGHDSTHFRQEMQRELERGLPWKVPTWVLNPLKLKSSAASLTTSLQTYTH